MSIEWKTERRKVKDLKEYDKNPRSFTDKGLSDLQESMTRLGYIEPIAINIDGTIIGGHARKKMLKKMGIKEVDVRIPDRLLSDDEIEEAVVRLNKNIAGEWNKEKLSAFDETKLLEWGFTPEELGRPIEKIGKTDPDEVGELPEEPKSKLGDIYILGAHRLRCGDSTKAQDVSALLGGVSPHLMVTDPPYGVEYDANWCNKAFRADGSPIAGRAIGKVKNDDRCDWREAWALFPGNIAYVWHAGKMAGLVQASLEACEYEIRSQIIWAKNNFSISRGDYHWQHEPCWYAVKGKGNWKGDRKQTTLWEIPKPQKSETGHSMQKPVECMKRPIENNSSPGQAVYEPFSGSGTTIIAGEMTGRAIYAMELNPAYVDMAVSRWENFTGKKAKLVKAA